VCFAFKQILNYSNFAKNVKREGNFFVSKEIQVTCIHIVFYNPCFILLFAIGLALEDN